MVRRWLEDGDEGEDGVEHGAGVGHQQLLFVHVERGYEQLGGGERAPEREN